MAEQLPLLDVAETKRTPAGRVSITVTSSAPLRPSRLTPAASV